MLHDEKTVERHAALLADYAQIKGAFGCFANADQNPYTEELREAINRLPRHISVLAARRAAELLRERSAGGYATYAYDYEGLVFQRR